MIKKLIFMTGATGVLGQDLLKELLTTTEDDFAILARPKNRVSHEERVLKILENAKLDSHFGSRVHVIEGDVTKPKLGIHKKDIELLEKEASVFFHIAALTALNGTEKECEKINIGRLGRVVDVSFESLLVFLQ